MDRTEAKDRFAACLVGMAVGDALGRPANGHGPYDVRRLFQSMDGFFPCPRTKTPPGAYSAPTQLAIISARAMLGGRMSKASLAAGHAEALPKSRGWSEATRSSSERFAAGSPFEQCGADTSDPEFLARAIPVGLGHAASNALSMDEEALYADCEAVASFTNKGTVPALCAYVVARIARDFVRRGEKYSNPAMLYHSDHSLMTRIIEFCRGKENSSDDAGSDPLYRRLMFSSKCLKSDAAPEYVRGVNHGDGSCREVVAFAAFCALRKPDSHLAVQEAAGMGGPASLCAALVGGMCGAYNGSSTIPPGLRGQVEHSTKLEMLSEKLLDAMSRENKNGGRTVGEAGGGVEKPGGAGDEGAAGG